MPKTRKPKHTMPAAVAGKDAASGVTDKIVDLAMTADAAAGAIPPHAAGPGEAAAPVLQPTEVQPPAAWTALRVAVIDDAIRPPRLEDLPEAEIALVQTLLNDADMLAELAALGCGGNASADECLRALAGMDAGSPSVLRVLSVSVEAQRMFEEHRAFLRLVASLQAEVQDVLTVDPISPLPNLTGYNLILLDYFLQGPSRGGQMAVNAAVAIQAQAGRPVDQQIVLMSSMETVRDLRSKFRTDTALPGPAFAYVGKSDLDARWKVKAHLGMLERARPHGPSFTQYRLGLEGALDAAKAELLAMVDDLDIGDYAFLQGHALMKDGHPLGDYVFWLLSSQLMALVFERKEMRERQHRLDGLEFELDPFAATDPSKVVANLLHSALVSRNVGRLGPHPRAKRGTAYASFPLVQLGDVFLDASRAKAVVVMSADCDLAFSPLTEREPDAETPVLLVPGTPVRLTVGPENAGGQTNGIIHRDEVYRIVWDFAGYRSVPLGKLRRWLGRAGYDTRDRDRLRPLFALKLQQEFGAHLLRVGPPVLPPMTVAATGKLFLCTPKRKQVGAFERREVSLTRFKDVTMLRISPKMAGLLRNHCEDLRVELDDEIAAANAKAKPNLLRKAEALAASLENDDFWVRLLKGVPLTGSSVKLVGNLGFVIGSDWPDTDKFRVVLEINDSPAASAGAASAPSVPEGVEPEMGAISGAA